jgi:hypothetical protein
MFVVTLAIWPMMLNTLMQAVCKLTLIILTECKTSPALLTCEIYGERTRRTSLTRNIQSFKYMMLHEPGAEVHQTRSKTTCSLTFRNHASYI